MVVITMYLPQILKYMCICKFQCFVCISDDCFLVSNHCKQKISNCTVNRVLLLVNRHEVICGRSFIYYN